MSEGERVIDRGNGPPAADVPPEPGADVPPGSAADAPVRRPPAERPDPRLRPPDPAGTRPRHDPDSLLPARRQRPALFRAIDSTATEEPPTLPERPEAPGAVAAPASEAPHAARFQFLLGALIAFGVAAIAFGAWLINDRSSPSAGPAWSAWQPHSGGVAAAQEIADHVGPEYRLPSGNQLVSVVGGPLQVAGLPITVALRSDPANNNSVSLIGGTGVLYRMCGLGVRCSIDEGKASVQRGFLLRREALEMALYSFRYMSDVNQVVVFLPPKPGAQPTQALFFRPQGLLSALQAPLSDTLASRTPTVATATRSVDAPAVQHFTNPAEYSFSLTQSNQDAGVFLVLRPPGTPATSAGAAGAATATP